jgi:hypothetical protein
MMRIRNALDEVEVRCYQKALDVVGGSIRSIIHKHNEIHRRGGGSGGQREEMSEFAL